MELNVQKDDVSFDVYFEEEDVSITVSPGGEDVNQDTESPTVIFQDLVLSVTYDEEEGKWKVVYDPSMVILAEITQEKKDQYMTGEEELGEGELEVEPGIPELTKVIPPQEIPELKRGL